MMMFRSICRWCDKNVLSYDGDLWFHDTAHRERGCHAALWGDDMDHTAWINDTALRRKYASPDKILIERVEVDDHNLDEQVNAAQIIAALAYHLGITLDACWNTYVKPQAVEAMADEAFTKRVAGALTNRVADMLFAPDNH